MIKRKDIQIIRSFSTLTIFKIYTEVQFEKEILRRTRENNGLKDGIMVEHDELAKNTNA